MAIEMRRVDMRDVFPNINAIAPAPKGETIYKGPAPFEKVSPLVERFDATLGEEGGTVTLDHPLRRPPAARAARPLTRARTMAAARRRVSVTGLAAGVLALLGGGWARRSRRSPRPTWWPISSGWPRRGPSPPVPTPGPTPSTRPDPAAGPTVVGLGIFFQDVASLSDVDQTLDADV